MKFEYADEIRCFFYKFTNFFVYLFCVSFRMEIARLQRTIELKTKEMNRVKKLAKNILDQVRPGRA